MRYVEVISRFRGREQTALCELIWSKKGSTEDYLDFDMTLLQGLSREELLEIRGCGPTTAARILKTLGELGIATEKYKKTLPKIESSDMEAMLDWL